MFEHKGECRYKDLFVDRKDYKYGLKRISSQQLIVDYEMDDIYFCGDVAIFTKGGRCAMAKYDEILSL